MTHSPLNMSSSGRMKEKMENGETRATFAGETFTSPRLRCGSQAHSSGLDNSHCTALISGADDKDLKLKTRLNFVLFWRKCPFPPWTQLDEMQFPCFFPEKGKVTFHKKGEPQNRWARLHLDTLLKGKGNFSPLICAEQREVGTIRGKKSMKGKGDEEEEGEKQSS